MPSRTASPGPASASDIVDDLIAAPPPAMTGYLEKYSLFRNRRRHFTLTGQQLSYGDAEGDPVKGVICLEQVTVSQEGRTLILRGPKGMNRDRPDKTEYQLVAPSATASNQWASALRRRAAAPARMITSGEAFEGLLTNFRRYVGEAIDMNIIDIAEYSAEDYSELQRRRTAHHDALVAQRAARHARTVSRDSLDNGHAVVPPLAMPRRRASGDGLLHDDLGLRELGSRPLASKALPGSIGVSPAESALSTPRRAEVVEPTWHYLDVLQHAGAVMATADFRATDEQLEAIWAAGAAAGSHMTQAEHSTVLDKLVAQVKDALQPMLKDVVASVLRAYGARTPEEEATRLLHEPELHAAVQAFSAALDKEMEGITQELWDTLDPVGRGVTAKETFLEQYRAQPLVPQSCFVDITLDEVGRRIQQRVTEAAVKRHKLPAASAVTVGDCGLSNLGNTCYLNVALQCLAHTPMLRQFFLLGKHRQGGARGLDASSLAVLNTAGPQQPMPLCDAFATLLSDMASGGTDVVCSAAAVRRVLNERTKGAFAGYVQHDAQEALSALLDGLHEEMNAGRSGEYRELPDKPDRPDGDIAEEWWAAHTTANRSVVQDLFFGQQRSSVRCTECDYHSLCFDPVASLAVPVPSTAAAAPPTIREAVSPRRGQLSKSPAAPSPLRPVAPKSRVPVTLDTCMDLLLGNREAVEGITCPKCKQATLQRHVSLWRVPHYLVVTLKRFEHDMTGRISSKNEAAVRVPFRWRIGRWLHEDAPRQMQPPLSPSSAGPIGSAAASPHDSPRLTAGLSSARGGAHGAEPPEYELYASVHHHGVINGGHYVATTLSGSGGWKLFNDGRVYRDDCATAAAEDSRKDPRATADPCSSVYTLLYRRRL